MQRCLDLAIKGMGSVSPNPMVGCVIVHEGIIIGEGWHEMFGSLHAEVNAINAVKNKELLKKATLYVNLEPCAHHGKTPPCADLIIAMNIPYVVIGCIDTFSKVQGRGIEKMIRAGIEVKTGVLEKESRYLNRRFLKFHEGKRPFVILKWAETADGFLDKFRVPGNDHPYPVSSSESHKLVHRWRAEEQAILIGTNTALLDNPRLDVRTVKGKNPLRIAIDQGNRIPSTFHLKDGSTPTLIFTGQKLEGTTNLEYAQIAFQRREQVLKDILENLYKRQILSVLIEGGCETLNIFLSQGLWDETRIFISPELIGSGVKAPEKPTYSHSVERSGVDELLVYRNEEDPFASQK